MFLLTHSCIMKITQNQYTSTIGPLLPIFTLTTTNGLISTPTLYAV